MSKEEAIEVTGTVLETLPNAMFQVELENKMLVAQPSSCSEGWLAYEDALDASNPLFEPPALSEEHIAFLPYHLRLDRKPKGVVLPHAGQCWWIGCCTAIGRCRPRSRALAAVPLYGRTPWPAPSSRCSAAAARWCSFRASSRGASSPYCRNIPAPTPAAFPQSSAFCCRSATSSTIFDFSALKSLKIRIGSDAERAARCRRGCIRRPGVGKPADRRSSRDDRPPLDGKAVPAEDVAWPEGEVKLVTGSGQDDEGHGQGAAPTLA